MGPAGFEPATNRLCIPLRLSSPLSGLWAGLSLHLGRRPRVPAVQSLHLPASGGLGSGLPCHLRWVRLPRVWQEITYRFPDKQPLTNRHI